jgi:virginiamycin B lyase
VRAGATTTADFALSQADPHPQAGRNGPAAVVGYPGRETMAGGDIEFVHEYDTLYPPGPGRAIAERVCMSCHGLNFFPLKQWDRAAWGAAVDMMSKRVNAMDAPVPPGKMSPAERKLLIDYFAANFGSDAKKRALASDADIPVDEAALGKAMYVEYDLPKANVPNAKPRGQNPYFDNDGNVWSTDRGVPNAIVKLDPRTVTFQRYDLPEQGVPHGIVVDKDGIVWWGEVAGGKLGRLDPKNGKMERLPLDPTGLRKLRGHDPIVDHEGNVWLTVIRGNQLAKWDKKSDRIVLYEPPTANSFPYGADKDKAGNIWMSQFTQCRMAKFDPKEETWTEYPVLTAYESDPYCLIRRGSVDSKGIVWYVIFDKGIVGKLDPETEKMVEYRIPAKFSEPYDVWPDKDDNMWISDAAMGGALIKFDPRSEKFTFYPAVQRGDMPKIEITREGAIWYNPRSAQRGAVGVLYPDMTKMTTFAAHY